MIQKTFLLIALFMLTMTTLFSQTDDDNIAFLRVQNEIKGGAYRKGLNILSEISDEGKQVNFYISFSATCYEKLQIFDSAVIFYTKLYKTTKSFDAMKKVAEMKSRDEAKKGCAFCHGIGYYYKDISCSYCNGTGQRKCYSCKGTGQKDCYSCSGSGKCYRCGGTGKRLIAGNCPDCYGSGHCNSCSGKGSNDCTNCKGDGKINCGVCNGTGITQSFTYCPH